jgi:WD repeat-containing protein 89
MVQKEKDETEAERRNQIYNSTATVMSLEQSPALRVSSSPFKSTTITSEAYVLCLASIHTCYAASQSAPSNLIDLFDKTTLRHVQTLPGHKVATTYLRTVDNIAGFARQSMISSGQDGTVKVWDDRSNSESINREWIHSI